MSVFIRATQHVIKTLLLTFVAMMTAGPVAADQFFADFKSQGTFETLSWEADGLRVHGSAALHFLDFNGIGVIGENKLTVDPGESITFSFIRPASQVRLVAGFAGNLAGLEFDVAEVSAIGPSGESLGLVTRLDPFPSLNVSALYGGGTAIRAFTIRATSDVYIFSGLSYVLTPVPEPDHSSLWIFGVGVLYGQKKLLNQRCRKSS